MGSAGTVALIGERWASADPSQSFAGRQSPSFEVLLSETSRDTTALWGLKGRDA